MSNITYHGFAEYQGRSCVVIVVDGETPQGELPGGPFSWGKGLDEDKANALKRAAVATGGRNLAMALCTHVLNGREDMAKVVATRLQHRKVVQLTTGKDFMLRRSELAAILQEIVESAGDNDKLKDAVDRERAPIASEAGLISHDSTGKPITAEVERNGVPASKIKDEDL